MKNYSADECSMGDSWTDSAAAAKLWNKHIAPILLENTDFETSADPEPPTVSASPGRAQYADEWAWERFCELEAGENETLTIQVADELRAKLSD